MTWLLFPVCAILPYRKCYNFYITRARRKFKDGFSLWSIIWVSNCVFSYHLCVYAKHLAHPEHMPLAVRKTWKKLHKEVGEGCHAVWESPEGGTPGQHSGLVSRNLLDLGTPEEAVVFHTFLPEVFAFISAVKKELNSILVITLEHCLHLLN